MEYIFLESCKGMCNDGYKTRVKNLINEKITTDDLEIIKYDKCKCDRNKVMYYTYKCTHNIFECNCKLSNDKNEKTCVYICSKGYNIKHQHEGECKNVTSCDCTKNHYKYHDHIYVCDGTYIYAFDHNYDHHDTIFEYTCGKLCSKFHQGSDKDKVVKMHNQMDSKLIDKMLKEAELCGERCRFSKMKFEKIIHQEF